MERIARKVTSGSWKKIPEKMDEEQEENTMPDATCPGAGETGPVVNKGRATVRSKFGGNSDVKMRSLVRATSQMGGSIQTKVVTGVFNFSSAIGAIRQKLKRSATRRHKRLGETTPSPFFRQSSVTPGSSERRSVRLARREVKMYSPFVFDETPIAATPTISRIRMGTIDSKSHDLATVDAGMQSISHEDFLNSPATARQRPGIRTTPRAVRTPRDGRTKPLFV